MTFDEICEIYCKLKSPQMAGLRNNSAEDFLDILHYISEEEGRERCRKTYRFTYFLLKINSYENK